MTPYLFVPSSIQVPSFSPTLDGSQYNCTVTWNVSAQRYYLNCFSMSGLRMFTLPVVESPPALDIEFLTWNSTTRVVTGTTKINHGFPLGQEVILTVENASPDGYNGTFMCLITKANQFKYYLNVDPGKPSKFGYINYLMSMTAGYFNSSIIFRNQQFEVRP